MEHILAQNSDEARESMAQQVNSLRADIEEHYTQIAAIEHRIRALHSAMNDATPIGRLHPEILAEVFREHVALWLTDTKEVHSPEDRSHWINILHVCCAWRQLAFQTPRLWTSFRPTFSDFVRESVKRSGVLPLDILIPAKPPPGRKIAPSFEHIFEQVSRLRSVQIVFSVSLREQLSEPRMNNLSAPMLETLDLTSERHDVVFPAFTTMSMPRLTSLTLFRGPFDNVEILAHERITHLTLKLIRNATLPPFLDVLRRLPALVCLSTNAVCDIRWPFSAETWGTPVSAEGLRRLTHLSIVNSRPFSTAFILHHLHVPVQANVRLCSGGETSRDEAVYMLQRIRERIFLPLRATPIAGSAPLRPRIKTLRLHMHWDWHSAEKVEVNIAAWTEEVPEATLQFELYPEDARFVFLVCGADDIMDILVEHLLVKEELEAVTMLALQCAPPLMKPRVWAKLFTNMPNLRWLNLEHQSADAFAAYHNSTTRHASVNTPPTPLYPSLKQLTLIATRFARCWSGPHSADLLPDLVAAFTAARDQGLHLERLQIDIASNLTDDGIDMLRNTGCADVVEMMDDGEESNGACSTADHARSDDEDDLDDDTEYNNVHEYDDEEDGDGTDVGDGDADEDEVEGR